MRLKISIVIPILNEVKTIRSIVDHLISFCDKPAHIKEIIIVDGGSVDESVLIVNKLAKENTAIPIRLHSSKKGRARQLNAGASIAKGDILYFLHADSFPPKGYDQCIIDEVIKGNDAGCFRMKFDSDHWWLRFLGWLTKFKSKRCRGGDQSQYITTSLFKAIDGYDESFVVYEDNDLVDRLFAIDQFTIIPKDIVTSARRYEEVGVWRLQYHFLNIHMRRWMGASSENLYRYYKDKVAN
ncbi:TIGR04283 family arsenosugar biosynthesis glycosyltransferase [Aquimarina sp. 2201CG1-2-11]|uniref:TIGR04283 family arsenosugar biosynthesis glycosyltransferase n=1 Tax=Aquimarina discodermiae TaxID=3231043 RepID=UPI003461B7A2